MEVFVLVISIWGNDGNKWLYTGNQYIMSEMMQEEECLKLASSSSWNKVINNLYYDIQFDCFHKDDYR